MGRTQSRPQSKSYSRPVKQIAKKPVHKSLYSKSHAQNHSISDADARCILARGLTVSEAVELMTIFHCGIKQLLRMYKCRKSRLHNAIAKARAYLSWVACRAQKAKQKKPPPRRPPSKKKVEVVHWIGDHLDEWVPGSMKPRVDDTVSVETKEKNVGHPAFNPIVPVKVTKVYDTASVVKRKKVAKTNVEGVLKDTLRVYEFNGGLVKIMSWDAGTRVRFYKEHVASVERT